MKNIFFLVSLLFFLLTKIIAQNNYVDSLQQLIISGKDDTLKAQRLLDIGNNYLFTNTKPDSGLAYARRALILSQKNNYPSGEVVSYQVMGESLNQLGDYVGALKAAFEAVRLSQRLNDSTGIAFAFFFIGATYKDQGDYNQALVYLFKANNMYHAFPDNAGTRWGNLSFSKNDLLKVAYDDISSCYLTTKPDSALFYAIKSYRTSSSWGGTYPLLVLANAYAAKNQNDSALYYFGLVLKLSDAKKGKDYADNYIGIANVFKKLQLYDSSILYAKKGLELSKSIPYEIGIYKASGLLAELYGNIDPLESLKYYKLNKATNDGLFNQQKTRDAQSFAFNEQLHQQELQQKLEQANLVFRNRLNIYFLLAGLAIVIIVAGGLWRRNVFKQKSYALLQKQKQEIDFQKTKAEKTLEELKSTQAQLIQSEKMASLGELTTGIAHEIQNPLNFINNFSDVNSELLAELNEEIAKGRFDDVKEIAKDVIDNEEKINHHGRRADAIVKAMLQHSRTSRGEKEPTDIDRLADEYLRLAYHGFKEKNKSFEAKIETDFDGLVGQINVVPQDIGRVLLNLINNAFYTVNEKAKQGGPRYEPSVIVGTRRLPERIEVRVKDNGNGIRGSIKEKIFQPFITTKPTGQGTGLGLSLAYDIVKAHGGEIKVESKEGEGSEFIILMPVSE